MHYESIGFAAMAAISGTIIGFIAGFLTARPALVTTIKQPARRWIARLGSSDRNSESSAPDVIPRWEWKRGVPDQNTGLDNAETFEVNLSGLAQAQGATLLLIQLDRYASLRSRFGTETLDGLINQFAALLNRFASERTMNNSSESTNLSCRASFDTFALLFSDPVSTLKIEEIRRSIRDHRFQTKNSTEVLLTASFGFSAGEPGESGEIVMARAKAALSKSQRSGRNQLHIHNGQTVSRLASA